MSEVDGISSETRIERGSGVMIRYTVSSYYCKASVKRDCERTVARKIARNAGELPPSPFLQDSSSSSRLVPSTVPSITSPKVPALLKTDPTLPFLGLAGLGLVPLLQTHNPDVHDDRLF
jgi:hypothetical protein